MDKTLRLRIIIKFADEENYFLDDRNYNNEILKRNRDEWHRLRLPGWTSIINKYPQPEKLTLTPLFTAAEPEKILELQESAKVMSLEYSRRQDANLLSYFAIDCPEGYSLDIATQLKNDLLAWNFKNDKGRTVKVLKTAYIELPTCLPTQQVTFDDPEFNQKHLKGSLGGIDALTLWSKIGSGGFKQHFIDIEFGWGCHEQIPDFELLHGLADQQPEFVVHGARMLGIVCAKNDGKEIAGIAPHLSKSRARKVAIKDCTIGVDTIENRANAILKALEWLPFGGVLLLEIAVGNFSFGEYIPDFPTETQPSITPEGKVYTEISPNDHPVYNLISLAIAKGLTVIEPAGNAGKNINSLFIDASGQLYDSGAIMVGASEQPVSQNAAHPVIYNYGEMRLNCFAIGKNVQTIQFSEDSEYSEYSSKVSGTSPASAIIAGVALSVQGIIQAKYATRIDGKTMRELLMKSEIKATPDTIGVMPDATRITQIIDNPLIEFPLSEISPLYDLYCKDNSHDKGYPFSLIEDSDNSPSILLNGSPSFNEVAANTPVQVQMQVWNRGLRLSPAARVGLYAWKSAEKWKRLEQDFMNDWQVNILPVPPQAYESMAATSGISTPFHWTPEQGVYYLIGVIHYTGNTNDYLPIYLSEVIGRGGAKGWLSNNADSLRSIVRDCNKAAWRKIVVV